MWVLCGGCGACDDRVSRLMCVLADSVGPRPAHSHRLHGRGRQHAAANCVSKRQQAYREALPASWCQYQPPERAWPTIFAV